MSFSLVLSSGWSPSVELARARHAVSQAVAPWSTQLRYGPSVFVLGESSCAVSIARSLWCAPLSFLSPPWAGEPKVSRALNIAYRDFLGPAGDGRGFSISFFSPLLPGGAPVKKDRGHVVLLARFSIWSCQGAGRRRCFSGASSSRPCDASRLEAVSSTLVCSESREKGGPRHVRKRWRLGGQSHQTSPPARRPAGLLSRRWSSPTHFRNCSPCRRCMGAEEIHLRRGRNG